MLMSNNKYRMLVGCRDLIYPGGAQIYYYVLWVNPADGGKAVKLGDLGLGKKQFDANKPFSSMFVTTEKTTKVKSPSGPTVMQGRVESITFLERPQSPTPTPEGHEASEGENGETAVQRTA